MLNDMDWYRNLAQNEAYASKKRDQGLVNSIRDHYRRMLALESPADRQGIQIVYRQTYKDAYGPITFTLM